MKIIRTTENYNKYMHLLLIGDESVDMVKTYINSCDIYILYDIKPIGICAVLADKNIIEIKNIAILPENQHKGYGSKFLKSVIEKYKGKAEKVIVGTGESPITVSFYKNLGFVYSHRIKDFFTINYNHPIIEAGVTLKDMVYFKKNI